MSRVSAAALAASLCLFAGLSPAVLAQEEDAPAVRDHAAAAADATPSELIFAYHEAVNAGDWLAAYAYGRRIVALDNFPNLPKGDRFGLLLRTGYGASQSDEPEAAIALYNRAGALFPNETSIWHLRFLAAIDAEDWATAFLDIRALIEADSDIVDEIDPRIYDDVLDGLKAEGFAGDEIELAALLIREYDNPLQRFDSKDHYRERLIRRHIERDEIDEAMARVAEITQTYNLSVLRYERTFEPLWNQPEFDRLTHVEQAADAAVETARRRVADHPDLLEPVGDLIYRQVQTGRLDEAQTTLDTVLARIAAGDQFIDQDDRLAWIRNQQSDLHFIRGEIEAGLSRLREASELDEMGTTNVSQLINYHIALVQLGRYEDALGLTEAMSDRQASDTGWAFVRFVEACAAHALGREEASAEALAWFDEERERGVESIHQDALICTDHHEAAVDLMVERVEDDVLRSLAMHAVQPRLPLLTSADFAPYQAFQAKQEAVYTDPRVQAAVARYGRVERWDLYER